ncbi:heat-inducible transcriptional repressor HrcA [Sphingorhabdus lutea]|uniref:Heat-inducible transcription repressor HrcA n=1 Tax=Sphingorhabdus lutea TaxID=1913578 RepID=A0A1L3JET7_9SPHN|nr:heat-inducible transcriptional repressor HrcA [Sphingorhabdus lutea]APG63655.1 heat-inducible transcriptional repressor HrcA [Sphingorhabdus lutea]
MTMPPIYELNDRTRTLFRVIVEQYLDSGLPVGSRTLSKISGLSLSSASIRNVMQDLEEMGLLAAPHTSAGRLPTESGLRLFVDGMMRTDEPTMEEQRAIKSQITGHGPIEEALASASQILSGLSSCAGIVMAPKREAILKQFSFARLSQNQILAIMVASDGHIENRIIELNAPVNDSALVEASNYMTVKFCGMTLNDAKAALDAEIRNEQAALDRASANLVKQGLAIWSIDADERPVLIVKGQSNLLDEAAVNDLDRIRNLLDDLENKQEIAQLVDSARSAQSMRIFIGSENRLFSLSGSSIIAAPYHDEGGKVVGVVGVIGPTRLNYGRIIPMVDFTAKTLSTLIK